MFLFPPSAKSVSFRISLPGIKFSRKEGGCKGHSQGFGAPVQSRYPSAKNHFRYGAQRSFGAGPSATRNALKKCRAHFYLQKCKAAASLFPFVFGEGAWMIGWWPIWEGCNSELMWQVQWQNWCQLKLRFHQLRKCQQFAFSSKKRKKIYIKCFIEHMTPTLWLCRVLPTATLRFSKNLLSRDIFKVHVQGNLIPQL